MSVNGGYKGGLWYEVATEILIDKNVIKCWNNCNVMIK